jgi:aryl-alcohol dehydrogenase-like predicted oxidoreductase
VVRNLSDTGAALEVASPLGIPQAFNLLISGDRTTYQCEIRWRKENRIGVVPTDPDNQGLFTAAFISDARAKRIGPKSAAESQPSDRNTQIASRLIRRPRLTLRRTPRPRFGLAVL